MDFNLDSGNDRKVLVNLLYEAIRDEGQRIVSAGLATASDVLDFVNPYIKQSFTTNEYDECDVPMDFIRALGTVHNKLMNVKLPGDFVFKEQLCVNTTSDSNESNYIKISVNNLIKNLEECVLELGFKGKYVKANSIQNKIDELKLIAQRNDVVISKDLNDKINKNG